MPTKEYGGKSFEIRGLKRGEIKMLRKKGFNLAKIDAAEMDIAADEIVAIVLGEAVSAADELQNSDYIKMVRDILEATYGSPESEKNLPTSGDGKAADV